MLRPRTIESSPKRGCVSAYPGLFRSPHQQVHLFNNTFQGAFSLIELVIVLVIVGILAAIAVPKLSNSAESAQSTALQATLATVRRAMELYNVEHGSYPGYDPSNGAPNGTHFISQLTRYSDGAGKTQAVLASPYLYGPYLKSPFPMNPYNGLRTVAVIANRASTLPAKGSTGWVAILETGEFGLNLPNGVTAEVRVGHAPIEVGGV